MKTIKTPKEDIDFGKRFARAQHPFITGKPIDRIRSCYKIKTWLDFPDLCQAADFIERNVNPKFQELIFGRPLPQTYEELGKCEFSYPAENFISEINWTLITVRKYSYQINLFLAYKQTFEQSLLIGNFLEAEKYLDKIETEICFSLWSLENRFVLAEYKEGIVKNKELLSRFTENNKSICYTKSLAYYLSIRAEKSLSVDRYSADLKNDLQRIQGGKRQQNIEYYLFKLSFINTTEFTHYREILAYDFQHSVVDRYLTFRKILTSLLTMANMVSGSEESADEIKLYIFNRLNYLLRKIDDPILFKLKLFASDKIFPAFDQIESDKEISIIDKYTAGLYHEAENEVKSLLLTKPDQFDLYPLYIKALVYQKKHFVPIGVQTSIQNQILSEIYKIISVSVSPIEAGLNLLRIANNLSGCVLSYGIIDFVLNQTKERDERKLFARLSYNAANPIINDIFPNRDAQIDYLKLLKHKFPQSISVDFLLDKLINSDAVENFEKKIPQAKYQVELAKINQKRNNLPEACKIWEELIANNRDTIPILETSIRNLYMCYEWLGRYDDCIKLFVDSYFLNEFIVAKIETANVLNKIRESRFKIVHSNIELPIYYSIVCNDESEVHTSFEKFNLSCGVCKPSELLMEFYKYDYKRILYFLKNTCSPEILKHSIHISGSKEKLEERLKIVQFLKEKDPSSKRFYEDEIKNITNILIIQKGLLELDESKIYVNEQGIINNELKEFEAVYLRFKAISKVAEKSKVWVLDKHGRLGTLNYSKENVEAEKVEYSSNPVYDVYRELFDAIKEKFLHSKFGIVAYLSTRIRHGVLIGEIRPIFEKHKLITQKEGDSSSYRRNFHWDLAYSQQSEVNKARIQAILKDFSYSVDGLIFDLIKKYLQVLDEESNPDGWFDYHFSDDELFWFSIRALSAKDFEEFAKQAFEILWDKTDQNLNIIRTKIQTEISKQFNDLFDTLERDFSELLGPYHSQVIIKSIKDCSTETQSVIKRVSSWFKRSGTVTSDFQLDNLVDIVMEYCNKSHLHQKVNLSRSLNFEGIIKGEFYTHFADLFRIFFENILKHADEKVLVIQATIKAERVGENLVIVIQNDITNMDSADALRVAWSGNTMNVEKLVKEGKSGYYKALKILTSDLKYEGNSLATSIKEDGTVFAVSMQIHLKEIMHEDTVH